MASKKLTTGLTRLNVAPNPRYTLNVFYKKIMNVLEQMPEDAAYRKYTHQVISERSAIVQQEEDTTVIEAKINAGQVEELMLQAAGELSLARKMLVWKPWEPLAQAEPKNQWKWPAV